MPDAIAVRGASTAVALGVVSFFYRFNTLGGSLGGFGNDQFIHLARAQQILAGGLPHRDFVEPGAPLTSWASAWAQQLGGHTLAAEAVLTVGMLSVGVALTAWMAARITGRVWIALLVGLLQISIAPRLYNYPKIFCLAVGIWLCWRYVDRPSLIRIAPTAAWIAVAFLFRHDYLFYLGPLAAATVVLTHREERGVALRRLVVLGAIALACVTPYLVFVQASRGLTEYVAVATAFARADADRTSFEWPRFDLSLSAPPVALLPPAPPPPVRVNVQWSETISDADRIAREARYGLRDGEHREGTTWNYDVGDRSRRTLEALVSDPLVRDTHGINRVTFMLSEPMPETGWRDLPRRVRFAPELHSMQNVVAWLYYTLVLLPGATALAWVSRRRDPRHDPVRMRQAAPYVWPVIGVSVLLGAGFLSRGTTNARLADVAVPAGILTAWVVASARLWGSPARLAGVLVLAVTTWSIAVLGAVPAAVERSRIASPADALSRFRAVWRTLSVSPPLKSLLRDSETPFAKAAAYVDRCVPRASRVFVLGNLPELYFFAQRPFAGGHAWIIPGYASTNDEQQLIIDRLRAFDVPLILTEPDPLFTDEYVPDFSLLVPYLTSRYDVVGSIAIGDTSTMRVHLLEGAAWRDRDEPTGLPCAPSSSLTSTR